MTSASSAAGVFGDGPMRSIAGGADDVVDAAHRAPPPPRAAPRPPRSRARRGRATSRRPRPCAPRRDASSAIARPIPLVPPTTSSRIALERRARPRAPRSGTMTFIWSIRSAITMSIRVVILMLISSPATATIRAPGTCRRTRLQSSVADRSPAPRGRGVGAREDAEPERLGRLAASVAAPLGDLDDVLALDDDEGVGARDDGVGRRRRGRTGSARSSAGSRRAARSGRTASWTTTTSSSAPSSAASPLRVLSFRVAPPGDHADGHLERGRVHQLARLVDPARVRRPRPRGRRRRAERRAGCAAGSGRRRVGRTASAARRRTGCRRRRRGRSRGSAHRETTSAPPAGTRRRSGSRRPGTHRYHRFPAWSRSCPSAEPPPASRTSS